MTTNIDLKLIATLTGGILFNYLFWQENLALNLLLYALFLVIVLLLDKSIVKHKAAYITGSLFIFSGVMAVYNNSDLAIINYYVSLFVFVGCLHAQQLKTVVAAIVAAMVQYLTAPVNLFKRMMSAKLGKLSLRPFFSILKYLIIPLLVIIIFSVLYSNANSIFGSYVNDFFTVIGTAISKFFRFFFADLSFQRFMHLIFGITAAAGVFFAYRHGNLEALEASQQIQLERKRKSSGKMSIGKDLMWTFTGNLTTRKMALKTENVIGVISFAALNVLILLLNLIDLSTLWLVGKVKTDLNYSAELHNGTDTLIISIILAMIVIIYFFNGNLNFYKKNKTIKILAYIWIFQNLFLILTVLHKDYDYIAAHGLTYKRIGVVVFSALCITGLISVYIKVAKQKTFFYLLKTNTTIWFGILLVSTTINWDVLIVNYNIENREQIALDYDHLVSMSDKTLPLLDRNRAVLKPYFLNASNASDYERSQIMAVIDSTSTTETVTEAGTMVVVDTIPMDTAKLARENEQKHIKVFNKNLDARIARFKEIQQNLSWLSWNYRDWQTLVYFKTKK